MLAFTGTVKILDFGIARAAEFAEEEAKKGLIKGKVSYLSPEQIYVRPFDARADIFALGVVFHEMLTGRRLFQSKNDITQDARAAGGADPAAVGDRRDDPARAGSHRHEGAGDRSEGSLPDRGRHGGRPRAHADRGALLQPRAVEAAARAVPGGRRSAWSSSTRPTTRTRWSTPSPSRRRDAAAGRADPHDRPHAASDSPDAKRRRRGWTACCAPSARAWSGCAGSGGSRSRSSRWPAAVALGAVAYAAKKYLPELLRAAAAAGDAGHEEPGGARAAAPAAKPAAGSGASRRKKRVPSTHKTKGHAPRGGRADETTEQPADDAPMPPSPE